VKRHLDRDPLPALSVGEDRKYVNDDDELS
jgi:hypothetical protein